MPETFIKSNQTRSLGPKAMWPDDKTFWSIIFLITTKSNTFLSRKKKKKAMEWSQNHFEAYNSTYQILFVYNITLTWHLDQGHLQFCVNFMYVYGIIRRRKKLTKFYLSFFPTKHTYIYSYRAHLSKIFFTWRFHNISNSHNTITSCLLAMQNK